MNEVRKVTSVFLSKCDDGLMLVFSNETETTTITMDWVEAARMTMRLDEQGDEAYTMMQMGLDPYRASHRESFDLSWLQVGGQE